MYPNIKRILDFFAAFIALVIISPVFLLIMIMLLLFGKTKGVFFLHERPGKGNKIFKVIKFKTMKDIPKGSTQTIENKDRVTALGTFLRKTSLDEIPQLINIIKGDMSLIGPRPLPVRYLELYSDEQLKRHNVRPGLTGWAQVNGRNSISWTRKFELDIWYVNHLSFGLDVKIFFMTIFKIMKRADIDASDGSSGGVSFNGSN